MNGYKEILKKKMDGFAHLVYKVTKNFPKEEAYGSVSQIRRASLSVVLNYIEGFARRRPAVQLNFFEISYGSLKESQYLVDFALEENYIGKDEYAAIVKLGDEIGAMLWTEISSLEEKLA